MLHIYPYPYLVCCIFRWLRFLHKSKRTKRVTTRLKPRVKTMNTNIRQVIELWASFIILIFFLLQSLGWFLSAVTKQADKKWSKRPMYMRIMQHVTDKIVREGTGLGRDGHSVGRRRHNRDDTYLKTFFQVFFEQLYTYRILHLMLCSN